MSIENTVIEHLNVNGPTYTKALYKLCGDKGVTKLSLNKFRTMLRQMENDKLITYIYDQEYPKWKIV